MGVGAQPGGEGEQGEGAVGVLGGRFEAMEGQEEFGGDEGGQAPGTPEGGLLYRTWCSVRARLPLPAANNGRNPAKTTGWCQEGPDGARLPKTNATDDRSKERLSYPCRMRVKTLFLVRHAKSSWDNPALPDRERPLAARGIRDLATMGKRLAGRHLKPDLILSSPAARALATAEGIAESLGGKRKDVKVNARLYGSQAEDLLAVIRALGDEFDQVILVGHNPELTELAHRLSGNITQMPTCAIAEFRFDAKSWSEVGLTRPAHVTLDYPKKE